MTQIERQLIIKDICSMLPYGVKFESYDNIPIVEYCACNNVFIHEQGYVIIELLDKDSNGNTLASTSINLTTVSRLPKPYLRPMSSMTEEEKNELGNFVAAEMFASQNKDPLFQLTRKALFADFFNKHHIDYRGFIEDGFALEAPEGMYEIK